MSEYNVKLDGHKKVCIYENILFFKKGGRQLKRSHCMHNPYLSPNFQCNGINSLPVDDHMFFHFLFSHNGLQNTNVPKLAVNKLQSAKSARTMFPSQSQLQVFSVYGTQ